MVPTEGVITTGWRPGVNRASRNGVSDRCRDDRACTDMVVMSSWSLQISERRDSISAVVDAQGLLPTAEITGTGTSITRSAVLPARIEGCVR